MKSKSHPLLKQARATGTPLLDNQFVTFIWQGKQAPELIGDFNNWDTAPGKTISPTAVAPGVWQYQLPNLPSDGYFEYRFLLGDERLNDPFNYRLITNGMGAFNNWFNMPDTQHTELTQRVRDVPGGIVTRHEVNGGFLVSGGKRTVYLYRPPATEAVSLLVVLDGRDYRTRAKLPIIVDNLIAQKRIRPIALALVQHGGQARFIEYMCNDATLGFLLREVLPLAQAQLNLLDIQKQPGAYGILGASMGGLIALYTGLRAPQIFGQVLSQSGAFGFGLPNMDSVIFDLIRLMPAPPIRVWLDVGRYEFLFQANQRMRDLLTERNYRFDYREYNGGHNYTAWRDDVAHGLVALFGR